MIAFLGSVRIITRSSTSQFIAVGDAVEAADKFGDHAKLDEIFRLELWRGVSSFRWGR